MPTIPSMLIYKSNIDIVKPLIIIGKIKPVLVYDSWMLEVKSVIVLKIDSIYIYIVMRDQNMCLSCDSDGMSNERMHLSFSLWYFFLRVEKMWRFIYTC